MPPSAGRPIDTSVVGERRAGERPRARLKPAQLLRLVYVRAFSASPAAPLARGGTGVLMSGCHSVFRRRIRCDVHTFILKRAFYVDTANIRTLATGSPSLCALGRCSVFDMDAISYSSVKEYARRDTMSATRDVPFAYRSEVRAHFSVTAAGRRRLGLPPKARERLQQWMKRRQRTLLQLQPSPGWCAAAASSSAYQPQNLACLCAC